MNESIKCLTTVQMLANTGKDPCTLESTAQNICHIFVIQITCYNFMLPFTLYVIKLFTFSAHTLLQL